MRLKNSATVRFSEGTMPLMAEMIDTIAEFTIESGKGFFQKGCRYGKNDDI